MRNKVHGIVWRWYERSVDIATVGERRNKKSLLDRVRASRPFPRLESNSSEVFPRQKLSRSRGRGRRYYNRETSKLCDEDSALKFLFIAAAKKKGDFLLPYGVPPCKSDLSTLLVPSVSLAYISNITPHPVMSLALSRVFLFRFYSSGDEGASPRARSAGTMPASRKQQNPHRLQAYVRGAL